MALGLTENTADLIHYVTVELWYIPRADTHSNHLKQRDRLIHPTNQYESPAPKEKHKSAAAPWSVFFFFHPPLEEPREEKKWDVCQRESDSGFSIDRRCQWAANSPWQLCSSMLLKVRRSGSVWGLPEHSLLCSRRCWVLLRNVEEKERCDKSVSACLATCIFS